MEVPPSELAKLKWAQTRARRFPPDIRRGIGLQRDRGPVWYQRFLTFGPPIISSGGVPCITIGQSPAWGSCPLQGGLSQNGRRPGITRCGWGATAAGLMD